MPGDDGALAGHDGTMARRLAHAGVTDREAEVLGAADRAALAEMGMALRRVASSNTEGDLMKLNGWASPQMLRRYSASAHSARPGAPTTTS